MSWPLSAAWSAALEEDSSYNIIIIVKITIKILYQKSNRFVKFRGSYLCPSRRDMQERLAKDNWTR